MIFRNKSDSPLHNLSALIACSVVCYTSLECRLFTNMYFDDSQKNVQLKYQIQYNSSMYTLRSY